MILRGASVRPDGQKVKILIKDASKNFNDATRPVTNRRIAGLVRTGGSALLSRHVTSLITNTYGGREKSHVSISFLRLVMKPKRLERRKTTDATLNNTF